MNMKQWIDDLRLSPVKRAFPILSFPSIQLMNTTVRDLISSAEMQARGMKTVADRTNSVAAVSMMDLSVEAEALGAPVKVSEDEIPAVTGHVINSEDEARALTLPAIESTRAGLYVKAIQKACELITDHPVFAGVIGPYQAVVLKIE